METLWVALLVLAYLEWRAQVWVLNKTFNIWFKQYMFIVHIKIILHIQVLVYSKKCSYPIWAFPQFRQSIHYSENNRQHLLKTPSFTRLAECLLLNRLDLLRYVT